MAWKEFGVGGVDWPDEVWRGSHEVELRGGSDAGLAGRGVTGDFESAGFGDGGASLGFEESAVDHDVEVDGVTGAVHDEFEDLLFGGARWTVAEDGDVGM